LRSSNTYTRSRMAPESRRAPLLTQYQIIYIIRYGDIDMKNQTAQSTNLPDREALKAALDRAISAAQGVALALLDIDRPTDPWDPKDEEALMRSAFAALVVAKELGGNQVALAPTEELIMKSCYYGATSLRNLKALAERSGRKESVLLREALDDLLRKHGQP